jgi:multicomponent Na+:H+ antiporter subunit G
VNELLGALLVVAGSVFCLLAAVGMIRLPDTLIRMHAATKAGTLGAGLILSGVAVCFADIGSVLKALLTLVFLFLTAPVGAHLMGRAAYRSGVELSHRTWVDQLEKDMVADGFGAEKTGRRLPETERPQIDTNQEDCAKGGCPNQPPDTRGV